MTTMDINADVGEGFDDEGLLPIVSSINIACGFHAGDASTMRRLCALAVDYGIAIGAHTGYADREGFGRRRLDIDAQTLSDDVTYQVGALVACAASAGAKVTYAKPHGEMYNRAAADAEHAQAIVAGISATGLAIGVLGPPGSRLLEAAAKAGLPTYGEGFADRAYAPDGSLVGRSEPDAVLDQAAAAQQALSIARDGSVRTRDGSRLRLSAQSLCVHSDSPGAVEIATAVRRVLGEHAVHIRRFA